MCGDKERASNLVMSGLGKGIYKEAAEIVGSVTVVIAALLRIS